MGGLLIPLGGMVLLFFISLVGARALQRHYRNQAKPEVAVDDSYTKACEDPDYREAILELNSEFTNGAVPTPWILDTAKKRWGGQIADATLRNLQHARELLHPAAESPLAYGELVPFYSSNAPANIVPAVTLYQGAVKTMDELPLQSSPGTCYYVQAEGRQYMYAEDHRWVVAQITPTETPVNDLTSQETNQIIEQCREPDRIMEPIYTSDDLPEPDKILSAQVAYGPTADHQSIHYRILCDDEPIEISISSDKIQELQKRGINIKEYIGKLRHETQNWQFLPAGIVVTAPASRTYEVSYRGMKINRPATYHY